LAELIEGLRENPEDRRRLGDAAKNLFDREYARAVVVPKIMAAMGPNTPQARLLP
jgi:hypothetical protein